MGEMVRTGACRAVLSSPDMHRASISADWGMCNTSSYACDRPLLHNKTATATSSSCVYAAARVGIGMNPSGIDDTVPGHQMHTIT
jgi:hypothetical protein